MNWFNNAALIPHVGMDADEVAVLDVPYTTRGPNDWISTGTLDPEYEAKAKEKGLRRLRFFPTWLDAELWAREFFGDRFIGPVAELANINSPYWGFHIKGD